MRYCTQEMMVSVAARRLLDGEVVFVGVGLPNLAANLAKSLHAPNLKIVYETGVIGAKPTKQPLSIGDPCVVTGAQAICSVMEVFSFYLQRGLIDVGFLGGAQVDKYGNLNSTVIGSYHKPKLRMPGSGGASEIALLAKKLYIIMRHERRRFPERVDFVTCAGFLTGKKERLNLGFGGGGPDVVLTDLGVLEFDDDGEMFLASMHPGVTVETVRERTGWDLKVSPNLQITKEPTSEELRLLRQVLDPDKIYLKGRAE